MSTNYLPVHRSPPENTQWSFYRHIIVDSRPSSGLFEYGPLRNRLEALWGFGKRALLEPNRVLVSRGLGERLGPLFRGLRCSSLLGLGTRPYHLSLKPGDISHDVFGLFIATKGFPRSLPSRARVIELLIRCLLGSRSFLFFYLVGTHCSNDS